MLAFRPVNHPTLDILDGGHEDCCSSLYTLVSRVCQYATGIFDSFLSEEDTPTHAIYTALIGGFSDLKASDFALGRPTGTRCCLLLLWGW